jgi:signal transduction histidine kinase
VILDPAVGLAFVAASGLVAARARRRGIALLFLATGLTWWAGGLGDFALFWHRGPLTHLLLAYPSGRLLGRWVRPVVIAGYVLAVAAHLDRAERVTQLYALLVFTFVAVCAIADHTTDRRGRWWAVVASSVSMGALSVGSLARQHDPTAQSAALISYEVALLATVVLLTAGELWSRWGQPTVTGLVVDLGSARGDEPLAEILASALGDPSARLFYWLPDRGSYVDELGRAVVVPRETESSAVTVLEHGGLKVGVMVHDPEVTNDPVVLEQVASLAWLAMANVRLQAEVQRLVSELDLSRRRIVEAADTERRRFADELSRGAEQRLAKVSQLLGEAEFAGLRLELPASEALGSLREFASGVHPRALSDEGLRAALHELVGGFAVPVDIDISNGRCPEAVESAAYYVCAEALTNAGKYATASHVSVQISIAAAAVTVRVTDNGVGGADFAAGTGLQGLRDRVEALAGSLTLVSPRGRGTQVTAVIPWS